MCSDASELASIEGEFATSWALEDRQEKDERANRLRTRLSRLPEMTLKDRLVLSLRKCSAGNGFCKASKGDCFCCSHQVEQDVLCSILIQRTEETMIKMAERKEREKIPVEKIVVESIAE